MPRIQTFVLEEEHIALLQGACIGFDEYTEYGAFECDPKRPYGNSGRHQIVKDMADLVGWDLPDEDTDTDAYEDTASQLEDYHKELDTALQIVLSCKSFEPGTYQSKDWGNKWARVSGT